MAADEQPQLRAEHIIQHGPKEKGEALWLLKQIIAKHHPILGAKGSGSLLEILFEQQKTFYDDPAHWKAALCTRRAGKSLTAAVAMIEKAKQYPGELVPYIALTRQSAKNIMWPLLDELNRLYDLGLIFNESKLEILVPSTNKRISRIFLIGADQKNFIDRLRGPKYPFAVIDEAGHFREHLEQLIYDVLDPALADFKGQLMLLGTPGPTPAGFFFEITEKKMHQFSVHNWSVLDNPYMPDARAQYEKMRDLKGEDNPTFQREWLGKWAFDQSSLVYRFNEEAQFDELPKGYDWFHVLGLDLGWNDQASFTVAAYSPDHPAVHILLNEGYSEMIPSDIAAYTKSLCEEYKIEKIVADTGGLGKSIAEEMKRRYHLPVEAAEKKDKMAHIELVNGDFKDFRLLLHRSLTPLKDQLRSLTKAANGKEDPTLPNDLCDSMLYAWRECKHWSYQESTYNIDPNTNQFMELWWEEYAEKEKEGDSWKTIMTDDLLD